MFNFRFGFWVGLVAGIVLALLWDTEQAWNEEIPVPIPEPPSQSSAA